MADWHERWQEGRIGFHRDDPNPTLMQFGPGVRGWPGRAFLPLCGKTVDLVWLARQGCRVVGNELVPQAVDDFFREQDLDRSTAGRGKFTVSTASVAADDDLQIWQGDYFDLDPEDLGEVDWVFDRASMIALPPDLRPRYVRHLLKLARGAGQILAVTLDYDSSRMSGPPYNVPDDELRAAYSGYPVDKLDGGDMLEPRWKERGLDWMTRSVWRIDLRGGRA